MAKNEEQLHFTIEGATPHTLPMARLAEYLKELAKLFGSEDKVHFVRVGKGSADCIMEVDEAEESVISERVQQAKSGIGPREAVKAFRSIRYFLDEDDWAASVKLEKRGVILEFPKKVKHGQETYGPFWQEGSLDGILVRIGGIDETVPVHLVYEGTHYTCNTTREVARKLAPHIFGKPIRVFGRGKWYRNADGRWEMNRFDIHQFEELSDMSLHSLLESLRSIPNNDLVNSKDPLGDMLKLRHG